MMKKLLGLIMVLSFSCSNLHRENNIFVNKDLENIVNKIIDENKEQKTLIIDLSDNEKRHVLAVFLFDYLENCKVVKGIYNYRNVNLIFTDVSDLENFDFLIDLKKSINLKNCKDYINVPEPDRIDYNAYYYLYDKEEIKYTNEKKLMYKDGSVVLRTVF